MQCTSEVPEYFLCYNVSPRLLLLLIRAAVGGTLKNAYLRCIAREAHRASKLVRAKNAQFSKGLRLALCTEL